MSSPPPRIFDPALRAVRRDRAARDFARYDFLYRHVADELLDRLAMVRRPLDDVLLIGCPDTTLRDRLTALGKQVTCFDPGGVNARAADGQQGDEDALPFPPARSDLVVACGTLDTVNDLPGALVQIRQILRPDGLLLGAMAGAGSLPALRTALASAQGERVGAHIHPQIELRALGDLLQRAGYALPVVDSDMADARYGSLIALMHDLRGMGVGNMLVRRGAPFSRDQLALASAAFAEMAEPDGKTRETFAILYFSAWAPDPSQPVPARRGSAMVSLAQALGKGTS